MAIVIKRQDGTVVDLDVSAVALGVNTSRRVGRQLEVTGVILSRTTEEAGVDATALGFSAEGPGIGHLLINAKYNPDQPTRGNLRILTFADGNVGIGRDFDSDNRPAERLVVQGNIVATGDVRLEGADCAEEFGVADDESPVPGSVIFRRWGMPARHRSRASTIAQ
jgi:hypothetical protein